MKKISEKTLREKIRNSLRETLNEEDIKSYNPMNVGIYDQPIRELEPEEIDEEEEEIQIVPSPESSMQLSQKRPDVESFEYIPGSKKELQIALHTLGEKVPEGQLSNFYRRVREELIDAIDKDRQESMEVNEVKDLPSSYYVGEPAPGTASLQQAVDATDIDSIAKMAQFENRLLKKIKSLLVTSKSPDIDRLLDASVESYMDVMKDTGSMTQEDIDFFKSKPERINQLKSSDLFRQFVGEAILQQGMRQIRLDTEKQVDQKLASMDLPRGADLTIRNHVMGNTNMTYQKMLDLVGKKAVASDFPDDKMLQLSKDMPKILKNLRDTIESLSNTKLIPFAMKQWIDSSKGKKIKLLKKAAQGLSSLYDAENKI